MCNVKYLIKKSSSAHGGVGFDLEITICDNPKHDDKFIDVLGKRAMEASVRIQNAHR
jgi:hypothetical protein